MKQLYINPASQTRLQALQNNLPHAILLSGKKGVGLRTIALNLAWQYDKTAFVLEPDEKGSIKIDAVRRLYSHTKIKKSSYQFVVIDDADSMQIPAQNALLKLLEEPPQKTVFVLTSHHAGALLSTIRSRLQEVVILPLSHAQTNKILEKLGLKDPTKRSQLSFIASGLPAELSRLAESDDYFTQRSTAIRQAREFISTGSYKKLLLSAAIGTDRVKALGLVESAILIVQTSLKQKPTPELTKLLQSLLHCHEKLRADGNVRVQLMALSLL